MADPILVLGHIDETLEIDIGTKEALGFALNVSKQTGSTVECGLIGTDNASAVDAVTVLGATTVYTVEDSSLSRFSGDNVVSAASHIVSNSGAGLVILGRHPSTLEFVPRLSKRIGGSCVMNVTGIAVRDAQYTEVEAAVYGGAARALYQVDSGLPAVLGLRPAAAEAPEPLSDSSSEVVPLSLEPTTERVRVITAPTADRGPRLEDAEIVVSGGRGLQNAENFGLVRELASLLNGLPGASRAIVDEYWAPPTEQIGLTGTTVAPALYLAAGISGASQHMAGCSNARLIVAINSDPEAPIFKYADVGIVDDCLAVLPELIQLLR
ncbi:MAG: electron transfer flavoprotein subunit alpha/FixB family protein [Chloroflexota bacterium]|nr:electron transfer flavoprotein subunit alpha/FixB family protein [Chloroflexota bacterium]